MRYLLLFLLTQEIVLQPKKLVPEQSEEVEVGLLIKFYHTPQILERN